MEALEKLIETYINDADADAATLCAQIAAGKRLRAKLIFKIAGVTEASLKLAAVVEMIHAASLLHDDVIDDALMRRGQSSINALYGDKTAIMLGDILYSKAFYELLDFDSQIAKWISDAVVQLSVGEMMDVALSKKLNTDVARYLEMIYKKTAVLIEATAKSAAFLCGKDSVSFGVYGKNLGLAFQIIDDVLDVTANAKTLGKPSLLDFKEGKTTLPYIYLFEALNENEKAHLVSLYQKELTSEQSAWIKSKMHETGSVLKAIEMAKGLGLEALSAIAHDRNGELERIMTEMIEREF